MEKLFWKTNGKEYHQKKSSNMLKRKDLHSEWRFLHYEWTKNMETNLGRYVKYQEEQLLTIAEKCMVKMETPSFRIWMEKISGVCIDMFSKKQNLSGKSEWNNLHSESKLFHSEWRNALEKHFGTNAQKNVQATLWMEKFLFLTEISPS